MNTSDNKTSKDLLDIFVELVQPKPPIVPPRTEPIPAYPIPKSIHPNIGDLTIPNLGLLKKEALAHRPNDRLRPKDHQKISPSQYANNFCLRRVAFALIADGVPITLIDTNDTFDYNSRRRMDAGTALHAMESEHYISYLDAYGGYSPWGSWKCSVCGDRRHGFRPVESCPNNFCVIKPSEEPIMQECTSVGGRWVYAECPIDNEEFMIKGTADLILKNQDNHTVVVDYKFTNARNMSKMKTADAMPDYYIQQLQLYGLSTQADIIILHWVERDNPQTCCSVTIPQPTEEFIQNLKETASRIKILHNNKKILIFDYKYGTIESNKLLPERCCVLKTSKKALQCPFSNVCFNN